MQLVVVRGKGRQLIITKIGASVGVTTLHLFPLNKMAPNINHILHGKKLVLMARSRMDLYGEH
jgi:hypothetical protein